MRRRQHLKAALAAGAALAVCGALFALPGGGWGPDGAAAPSYARNPAAQAALNPGKLTRVAPTVWRASARTDFSVWPARGNLAQDTALLRRALAVWARPGKSVQVSATPGTPAGAPPGPPQLLYAGDVDQARVVLLYDGLRIARYAEPRDGTSGAALDFARVDGATTAEASAVVLNRTDGNVRYLTAPWVTKAAERDLRTPTAGTMDLDRSPDGVTAPLASPAQRTGDCTSWNVLQLTDASGTRLSTDLGELIPAHLTSGRPATPHEAAGTAALRDWAPYACSLAAVRSEGVRSVNAWQYAQQPLPDASGTAAWVCTRADTWRGGGTRVLAQFHTPGGAYGAIAAKAENSPACGVPRPPRAGGRAVEVGRGGLVSPRGRQQGHGVDQRDGRSQRIGAGRPARRTDRAGGAGGAEGEPGGRAGDHRAALVRRSTGSSRSFAAVRAELPNTVYSCAQGFCGTCQQRVLEGEIEHRDELLTDTERADSMLICVSRARGERIVLDM